VNNIINFSTTENLNFLCKSNTIFVDGTFKSCCKMFTIHTTHNNHYIPIIFCLLPSKSKEYSSQTCTHILNECNNRNFNFIPKIVYDD